VRLSELKKKNAKRVNRDPEEGNQERGSLFKLGEVIDST
jgi:hypothetical protein